MIARLDLRVDLRDLADRRLVDAGLSLELVPRRRFAQAPVVVEPGRVALDELAVDRLRVDLGRLEHGLRDAAQQRHVAADPRLHVQRAGLGRVESHHAQEVVRDDRPCATPPRPAG